MDMAKLLEKLDPKDMEKIQHLVQAFEDAKDIFDKAPFQSAAQSAADLDRCAKSINHILKGMDAEQPPVTDTIN